MNKLKKQQCCHRNPWSWIPTLYFAEGLPYVAVMTISVIMYKKLGLSNTDIALYTSWLYLPWVIKPFWSPIVDILKSKRWWVLSMQWIMAIALAGIAFTLPTPMYFRLTLGVFWLLGFTSATHDIAADGYYMHALSEHEQSLYVGIRSTFYRIATVAGQGLLVILAGLIESSEVTFPFEDVVGGKIKLSWMVVFGVLSLFFIAVAAYHSWAMPRPKSDGDRTATSIGEIMRQFGGTFVSFFRKKQIGIAIVFMLLYRLPEAQLVKLINPFLLDPASSGGLGLSTEAVGLVYGTVGIVGLTIGGIVGGICAARGGLRRWLRPMAWSMSLTCLSFIYLSFVETHSLLTVNICVFIEQFGYGFGFTAYMLYLIYFAEGPYKTAHYSICTGFMALSMMLPGMVAGWIQENAGAVIARIVPGIAGGLDNPAMGYKLFFVWTMICCVATIAVAMVVKVDPKFGLKESDK